MDAQPVPASHSPFPVDPADVSCYTVRVMKRTLLRHADRIAADPMDDEIARLIVARLIAALHRADGGAGEAGAAPA